MNKQKKILFYFFIILLFFPIIQMNIDLFKIKPLKGTFELAEKPEISINTWISEDYQTQYDKFFNDYLGFRNLFVRLNNQMAYTFYNKVNAFGLAMGKEGYSYGKGYILYSYSGVDFIGQKKIDTLMNKTKRLQNKLKKEHNIDLIVLYAPSKEQVLPEYFPERLNYIKRNNNNIDYFLKKSDELDINYIDYNNFFRTLKDTSNIPIYYKQGEHWSYYTMCWAADSLVNYIEKLRGIDMPDVNFVGSEKTDKPRRFDYDQGDAMNLIFDIPQHNLIYPKLDFNYVDKTKPKVLGIADCYYLQMFNSPILKNCFKDPELWFYYKRSYKKEGQKDMNKVDIHNTILDQDVIIILHTNHTLKEFGYGFIDELEQRINFEDKVFKRLPHAYNKNDIPDVIKDIKKNKVWFSKVKKDAKNRNLSIDSMLTKSAIYYLKHK